MRTKALIYCEVCGGIKTSGAADFVVFHCLAFCSPDCRDEYVGRPRNRCQIGCTTMT